MKRLILVVVLVMLAGAVSAQSAFQEVKASVLRYEPTPAEQGRTLDVWVQFTNAGQTANNVKLRFEPEYPFSLPAGQPQVIDVGDIAKTEDRVEKFTVFVDPSAPNGDAMIKFWYQFGVSDDWVELEAPITLQTQDASLVIEQYDVTPQPAVPGQEVKVDMTIRNAGRIGIKNLDVSLDLGEKFSTTGTGTKQRVDYIPAGQARDVSFTIASDTSTEVKLYALPVNLDYSDDRGKTYEETSKVSLLFNAKPELALTVDRTDFASDRQPGTVSLKVVNKGVVDTKFMTVRLVKTPDYEILSPSNEDYVGNLDSDDFETVDFTIKPLTGNPRMRIQLEFKDPYNVDFQQEYDLPLRIITDEELGKTSSPLPWIIGLIVVAGLIYWWRKKAKKRKR